MIGGVPMQKINRNFGLIMSFCFFVLGGIIPYMKQKNVHYSLIVVSLIFFVLAIFLPLSLERIRIIWSKLGDILGKINTKILFTIIYLLMFSPIHLIFKILKRDKLKLQWKKYSSTFHVKKDISSFNDPF